MRVEAMTRVLSTVNQDTRQAIAQLFATKPPVLVEVRFPRMGTSSDWHLLEEEDELESIWEPLASGAELILRSVWDVHEARGTLRVTKTT